MGPPGLRCPPAQRVQLVRARENHVRPEVADQVEQRRLVVEQVREPHLHQRAEVVHPGVAAVVPVEQADVEQPPRAGTPICSRCCRESRVIELAAVAAPAHTGRYRRNEGAKLPYDR
jgi:hypothetical protein